jgi:AbrB family looped-hinge helix DNA binding protein
LKAPARQVSHVPVEMTFLHYTLSRMEESTLTERGQISIPASVRKAMNLRPGQRLRWQRISDREVRASVVSSSPPGALAVLGYARKLRRTPRTTASWMRELRAGED